jgi:hypothetical protein
MFIALIERDIDTLRGFEHQVNNGIEQYPMHGATVQQAWHQCMAIAALHYGDPSEGVRHIMHVLDVPTLSASQRMAPLLTELLLFSAIGEHDLVRHRRRAFDRAYADVMRERPLVKAVRDHALPKPTTQAALAAALQAVPLSPADRTLALTLQVRRFAMP